MYQPQRFFASLFFAMTCLLFAAVASFAELRESICIIKPQIIDSNKSLYGEISKTFRREGYPEFSDQFKRYIDAEIFGSGFLVKASDGSVWVLTNRHVVENSSLANLTFEKSDGTSTVIDNCPVSFVDNQVDLAFIELPAGTALPGAVLTLATTVPSDGTDVWSAGYPGLINKPSWQLGRGTISNRNLVVEELGPKEDAVYVQHTAPIDPGNSGGPLLVGDIKAPGDLKVIGVNTWSAVGRNNTFFSVSVSKVTEALSRAVEFHKRRALEKEPKIAANQAELSKRAQEFETFIQAKNFNEFAYQKLISNAMSLNNGSKALFESMRTMNNKQRSSWLSMMVNDSALETLRKYDSARIWEKFHESGEKFKFTQIEQPLTLDTEEQIVMFTNDKEVLHTRWLIEGGNWHLKALDKDPPKAANGKKNPKKVSTSDKTTSENDEDTDQFDFRPSGLIIGAGASFPDSAALVKEIGFAAHLEVDLAPLPFWALTVAASFYKVCPTNEAISDFQYSSLNYNKIMNPSWYELFLNFGMKLQLPINVGHGYIMPFIQGSFGFNFPFSMTHNASSTYGSQMLDLNFDLSVLYGFGIEFSTNKDLAFGASMLFINNLPLINLSFTRAMPVLVYIKPLFWQ